MFEKDMEKCPVESTLPFTLVSSLSIAYKASGNFKAEIDTIERVSSALLMKIDTVNVSSWCVQPAIHLCMTTFGLQLE